LFGNKTKLKKILMEACDFKHIAFVKTVDWAEVKTLHHKSYGFMVVGDMFFHGVELDPEYFLIDGVLIENERKE
jgi:hypothetical protein